MMDAEFAAARESIHRSIGQRARWAKTHIAREVSKHLPEHEPVMILGRGVNLLGPLPGDWSYIPRPVDFHAVYGYRALIGAPYP